MLRFKFDIDSDSLRYDRDTHTVTMTVQPLVAAYDEAALIQMGWGVMASCRAVQRLVMTVAMDDVAVALDRLPLRRVA